jgi:hypothetical protein
MQKELEIGKKGGISGSYEREIGNALGMFFKA